MNESKATDQTQRLQRYGIAFGAILFLVVLALGYTIRPDLFSLSRSTIDQTPTSNTTAIQSLSGMVIDKIAATPIEGATIKFGETRISSNANGNFSIEAPTKTSVTVEADGYISRSTALTDNSAINLLPNIRIHYVSNRDGKRGIYTALYDGSDDHALVPRQGSSEQYSPVVSPRERFIAYLSTEEGRKNKYGSEDPELYLVKSDGTNKQRISEFFSISSITWSPDGTYVAWVGREKQDDNFTKIAIRDITTGKTVYFGETGDSIGDYSFRGDDQFVAISISNFSKPNRVGIWLAKGNGDEPRRIGTIGSRNPRFLENGDIEFIFDYVYSDYSKNKTVKKVWVASDETTKELPDQKIYPERTLVPSPDKKLVAFIEVRDGKSNLFISKPDGSDELKLTTIHASVYPVRWSLNGKYITFSVSSTGETARYVVAASGKVPEQKIVDEYSTDYAGGY